MSPKKVIILDDHTLFLKGMTLILKDCCAECEVNTFQSISKLKSDKLNFKDFDLLISDIELPGEDAFELFTALKTNYPELPILVVSMHKKNAILKKCKSLGIEGYLLKDEDEQLTKAIETIIHGGKYYSSAITEFCKKTKSSFRELSEREEEIIKLIVAGYNNNVIADKLFVSAETVKTHKKNIRLKLNVIDNHGIIDYARNNFLV